MRPERSLLFGLLLAVVLLPSTAMTQAEPEADQLAEPKPLEQTGFPKQLYRWLIPPDNPQTPAKVALGKRLFFDPRLSEDNTVSCATCHAPAKGFTDQLPTSMGIGAKRGRRNAPTILNSTFNSLQFWDGREPTLEDQARRPILNPIEMGMKSPKEVTARIAAIPEYREQFKTVFGRPPNFDDAARAIAAYERTQVVFDTPFDRFMAGDKNAISEQAKRGWALFNGKGRCASCHGWNPTQPLFTDNRFHNIGVSAHKADFVPLARKALALLEKGGGGAQQIDELAIQTDMSELGRFLVTKEPHDIGAFRTMGLRDLLVTEPYFHDGSQATLWDTIDHYNKGGDQNPFLDGGIVPLGLTEPEIDDLVAFLATLTSPEYKQAAQEEYERQLKLSRTTRPERDTAAAMGRKGREGPGFKGPFGDIEPEQANQNLALPGGR